MVPELTLSKGISRSFVLRQISRLRPTSMLWYAPPVICRSSREASRALAERLPELLEQRGYRGLDLNFQYLFSFDRDNYSRFALELSETLHAAGHYLLISLPPKTGSTEDSPLCAGQDYSALGSCADRAILLCHDWGGIYSAPQAISPADRTKAVAEKLRACHNMDIYLKDSSRARAADVISRVQEEKSEDVFVFYDFWYENRAPFALFVPDDNLYICCTESIKKGRFTLNMNGLYNSKKRRSGQQKPKFWLSKAKLFKDKYLSEKV